VVDAESIRKRLAAWPLIEISGTAGIPPEIYRFTYRVKGLYVDPTGNILERDTHLLEVNLSLGYPRRAPQCRMLTPVFHPNFDDSTVCIGDFWAASESLDDLVIRIGRMIAYQEYNTKSPLNGLAAKWAAQNASLLPVDTRGIAPPSQGQTEQQPAVAESAISRSSVEQGPPPIAPPPTPVFNTPNQQIDPWSEKIVIE
jgi:ubiquitin-protein ligase